MILPLLALAAPHFAVLQRIPLPGDDPWDYLTVRHEDHRLYIARGSHVQVMDTRTGTVVADLPNVPGAHGVALAPEYHVGLATSGTTNVAVAFDTDHGAEIKRIRVGEKPDAVVYEPHARRFVVLNGNGHTASIVDPVGLNVVDTIPLDGKPEFAAADGRGHIYVNLEDKARVARIDVQTRRVDGGWSITPGTEPTGLAYDPDRELVLSACANGLMTVLDPRTGTVRTAPIGKGPDAATVDPKLGLAFVPNGTDGTLSIVSVKDLQTVQTLPTQVSARTIALDRDDHRLYLIAADLLPSLPGAKRGLPKPGTTNILVVGRA